MTLCRSSRRFRERAGLVETLRRPLPVVAILDLPVLNVAVQPPLPLAPYQAVTQGAPVPDRAVTADWPDGSR